VTGEQWPVIVKSALLAEHCPLIAILISSPNGLLADPRVVLTLALGQRILDSSSQLV
jgi:hypothetical protein